MNGGQGILCLPDRLRLVGVKDTNGYYNNTITFNGEPQSDFTVSIDVINITDGVELYLVTTAGSYYVSVFDNGWSASELSGGSSIAHNLGSGAVNQTQRNNLAITVQGATLSFELNGSSVASAQEANLIVAVSNGIYISVGASNGAQADFQNFVFTPLT